MTNPITPIVRADGSWERIVFAEVLIPNVPNVYNDYWTPAGIRDAAYQFMKTGFGIDIEHDNVDVSGTGVYVVESFIVRANDPTFIEGSWVVGVYIADDALWQKVLDGELNGFSYQALATFLPALLEVVDSGVRIGVTEPSLEDGHTHEFMVMVGADNRPKSGGTSETNGHFHGITTSTVTGTAAGHVHRYNLVTGDETK